MLKSVISFTLILFLCLYPIVQGIIILWMILIGAYIYSKESNTFVQHGRRCCRPKKHKELLTMHGKVFATNCPNEECFAWDTYGLPFVVDNSATAIICNLRKLFTGKIIRIKIMLETGEGTRASTKLWVLSVRY